MGGTSLDAPTGTPWLVIHSKPNRERAASDALEREGLQPYLPLAVEATGGRPKPFFPRYLFVPDPAPRDPIFIRYLTGVSDVIRSGARGSFSRIAPSFIWELRAREGIDGLIDLRPFPDAEGFHDGDAVVIDDGGISWRGTFRGMKGERRAEVLLSILGSQQRATVDVSWMRKVA